MKSANAAAAPLVSALALFATLLASPSLATAQIDWRSGPSARVDMAAENIRQALSALVTPQDLRHCVLQFRGPVSSDVRARLKAAGVTLQSFLGNHAYFARVEGGRLTTETVATELSILQVAAIQRDWKMQPALIAREIPEYALGSGAGGQTVAAYALFHEDVTLDQAREVVRALGGLVQDRIEPVNGLVLEVPLAQLDALADDDRLMWIELALPPFEGVNDSNRVAVQANLAQAAPYGLDGSGVKVLVYDAGTALSGHQDFGGRLFVRDNSGLLDHSTHVSGTVGGSGSASGGVYKGMAPAVTIQSYGFQYSGSGIFLYSNPGDLVSDYSQAINVYGVDIANNSIGTNTAANGFPCSIEGDYGVTSMTIDSIVRGSVGRKIPLVWANGNERGPGTCGTTFHTTAPPACAKNHLTIGAMNSNDFSVTSFTSWGPTDDGRLKPDVSGPGCQIGADNGVTSTSASGGYSTLCGTSMAAPTVTGAAALLIEDFRATFPTRPAFLPSTLKALVVQKAQDLGNPGPDYKTGYGMVRIKDTIDFMRLDQFLENSLEDGDTWIGFMNVPSGASEVKVSLAWDDYPATPNVASTLVNDLDLVLVAPNGTTMHYPWTLNPGNPNGNALKTQADHVNNLEQVQVPNPAAGTWRVEVHGSDIPHGPQYFSLAASHPISQGPVARYVPSVYPTIQAAIDASVDGDQVIVDQGTYMGAGNRDIDFLGKDIAVTGPYGPRKTIIDCQYQAIGVLFRSQETAAAHLQGFTIKHGSALDSQKIATQNGGGIYISNASPMITDCIVEENRALFSGAGIFVTGYGSPRIDRCVIRGNTGTSTGSYGGGVGISNFNASNVELMNSMIVGNSAGLIGGGVYCGYFASQPCTLTIRNCTIAGNRTTASNGTSGGIHYVATNAAHNASLRDCIVWGNVATLPGTGQQLGVGNGSIGVDYCDVAGGTAGVGGGGSAVWGTGNLDLDPAFFRPNGPDGDLTTWQDNDFHVLLFSPVVNAGDPSFLPGSTEKDIDGDPRIFSSSVVDMGADERRCYTVAVPPPCSSGTIRTVPSTSYPTIEAAIAASSDCDIVEVEPGTYTPAGTDGIDFLGKDIVVRSKHGAHVTTIDCLGLGRGFKLENGESARATIEGFTIKNGTAANGGGIYAEASSVTISACVIGDNYCTYRGGGVYSRFGGLRIQGCQVIDNESLWGESAGIYFGGGFDSEDHLEMTNTLVARNRVQAVNFGTGGGLYAGNDALLRNCSFIFNQVGSLGGGIFCGDDTLVGLDSCILQYNQSSLGITNDLAAQSGVLATGYTAYTPFAPYFISPGNALWLEGPGNPNAGNLELDLNGHLEANSPCIDAGNPAYVAAPGETDVHGEPRINTAPVDIGSDEFHDCDGDGTADYWEQILLNNFCGPKPNGAGPGAMISAAGSLSVANNDLFLHVTGAQPNKAGIFFMSPNKQPPPYPVPDGCLAAPIKRLPGVTTDAHGDVTFYLDTSTLAPQWQPTPGSTYYFQFWFRDLAGGNPSGTSFSDAIELTFCN